MSLDSLTFPLPARRRVADLPFGSMRSSRRGAGLDVTGSRPYRPGDDVRRIDWRSSARLSSVGAGGEFIVREHLTEEATRVVVVVDRSPSMALFPPELPWLSKPAALAAAGSMIVDSAVAARCLVGYLDDADAVHERAEKREESLFWRAPGVRTEPWRVKNRYLPYPGFRGAADSLSRSLRYLTELERGLPAGTFLFLLSDFHALPGEDLWRELLGRSLDVVPVVIQDPVWEQSFPDVAGAVLSVVDPETGRRSRARLTRAEARAERHGNEARLVEILDRFEELELDAVVLSSDDRGAILHAFLDWAGGRHHGTRL